MAGIRLKNEKINVGGKRASGGLPPTFINEVKKAAAPGSGFLYPIR